MWNGLIYRLGDDRSWHRLLFRTCALQYPSEADDWEEEGLAHGDEHLEPALETRGAYFVADVLANDKIYYLPKLGADEWGREEIQAVFGKPAASVIAGIFSRGSRQIDRAAAAAQPKPRRIRQPRIVAREIHEDASPDVLPELHLPAAGIQLASLESLSGPSQPRAPLAPPPPTAAEVALAHNEIHRAVQSILQQLCSNIISVSPNRQHGGSYCTLTPEAQNDVTATTFQQTRLPFSSAQIKIAPMRQWDTRFFNLFFPLELREDPNTRVRRQNFDRCSYFMEWKMLSTRLSLEDLKAIRAALLPWWQTLHWLPWPSNDRMWDTRPWKDSSSLRLPKGSKISDPSPKIAINERSRLKLIAFTLR